LRPLRLLAKLARHLIRGFEGRPRAEARLNQLVFFVRLKRVLKKGESLIEICFEASLRG
jgi:hypothetical protein